MKPRMFATAGRWKPGLTRRKFTTCWMRRAPTMTGCRNIATIGVRTYGWTFVNRKLEPPAPAPYVRLTAPSCAIWEYEDEQAAQRIEGRRG